MRDDPVVTDLVVRARGGARQAWDELVERYAPLIWCICRRYELRDAHAADVGQAVWLHLVEHLDSLRDPTALAGWLATTTRRECGRVLRATRDLPTDGRELQDMPEEQTATAEHELLAAERDAALCQAFARLPTVGQRLLAMLISDPSLPSDEISAKLGIPVGSIGPSRRCYLDRLRRDPAIAHLISTQTAGGDQAPARCLSNDPCGPSDQVAAPRPPQYCGVHGKADQPAAGTVPKNAASAGDAANNQKG
jgi:RNA polymerase sigma factor (sigma-70 family)